MCLIFLVFFKYLNNVSGYFVIWHAVANPLDLCPHPSGKTLPVLKTWKLIGQTFCLLGRFHTRGAGHRQLRHGSPSVPWSAWKGGFWTRFLCALAQYGWGVEATGPATHEPCPRPPCLNTEVCGCCIGPTLAVKSQHRSTRWVLVLESWPHGCW